MTAAPSDGTSPDGVPPDGLPAGGPGRKLGQLAKLEVSVLKGVGTAALRDLAELDIGTVLDLILSLIHI